MVALLFLKDTSEVALDALRVESVVSRSVGKDDVHDIVADVTLSLQLLRRTKLLSHYGIWQLLNDYLSLWKYAFTEKDQRRQNKYYINNWIYNVFCHYLNHFLSLVETHEREFLLGN